MSDSYLRVGRDRRADAPRHGHSSRSTFSPTLFTSLFMRVEAAVSSEGRDSRPLGSHFELLPCHRGESRRDGHVSHGRMGHVP